MRSAVTWHMTISMPERQPRTPSHERTTVPMVRPETGTMQIGGLPADRAPGRSERGPAFRHGDPLVMFAHLAAVTERIGFATGVLVLPQRQTALLARQAADVDLLSGARLRQGVGVGWNHVEYQALGQDFRTRGARQEERIGLLRRLFTEPVVDFTGCFDHIERAALVPRPARALPIRLGGSGDDAFERAARLADGFIFFGAAGIDRDVDTWNRLRERVDRLGRPVEEFGGEYVALPGGGIHDLTAQIDAWRDAGGSDVSVATLG